MLPFILVTLLISAPANAATPEELFFSNWWAATACLCWALGMIAGQQR